MKIMPSRLKIWDISFLSPPTIRLSSSYITYSFGSPARCCKRYVYTLWYRSGPIAVMIAIF